MTQQPNSEPQDDITLLEKHDFISQGLAARLPDDALEGWYHLTSMCSHRGDGIPTQHVYPTEVRQAAVALVKAVVQAGAGRDAALARVALLETHSRTLLDACEQMAVDSANVSKIAQSRIGPYEGKQIGEEMKALEAAVASAPTRESVLDGVWAQARENHERYSKTGSVEQDIRFFGLGLAGEAGEVANFIKKRWRDGDSHEAELRAECADVFAYNIMLADALGMSPDDLIAEVARKQQVFLDKMAIRAAAEKGKGE